MTRVREHIRNAFIHRRRGPSVLTSEEVAVYSHADAAGATRYATSRDAPHPSTLAMARMVWERILAPATAHTAGLLTKAEPS
jgi:hypothetical protein